MGNGGVGIEILCVKKNSAAIIWRSKTIGLANLGIDGWETLLQLILATNLVAEN